MKQLSPYLRVVLLDTEFHAPAGERPEPICAVFRELRTGQTVRLWLADGAPAFPPFGTGPETLYVAYYSSAEWGCFLALDWPLPCRVLDLFTEFRNLTSGLSVSCGYGLLGALAYFGLDGLTAAEKDEWRDIAIRGGPFTEEERTGLLDYCESDVIALAKLLPAMLPHIDLPRALIRGRYMVAAAKIERTGVPIDTETLQQFRDQWGGIKGRLIEAVNRDYGVYVPVERRTINPETPYGAAILETAREHGINPYRLADAAEETWRQERQAQMDREAARRAARKATGLDARRIEKWEESGKDYSLFPNLDETARDLSGLYPELGAGPAYDEDGNALDTDHAAAIWEALRTPAEHLIPKYDPEILRRAAEMVLHYSGTGDPPVKAWRFSEERWAGYLAERGIPWPLLETGRLALDDDTFREMARAYPNEVAPIRELRHALSQMRLNELAVGSDGRNRYLLSAFGSRTGRNQPSNTRAIFGPSVWLRCLIQPAPGRAVAYCDWSQQELAIAAALSGDKAMQDAYTSGDFYLTFAKMAGAVPEDATKKSHGTIRDQFKTVALGVLYGLATEGLARKLAVPLCQARELMQMHRETFRTFWKWSDQIEMAGMLTGRLRTVFGWTIHVGQNANPRSLRNFPCQGNGAEMMRLACCMATEQGIQVCAPVHDALLVEGPADGIEEVVATTQRIMREASELVLPGFPLRSEAKVIRHPERYTDERGKRMWETVQGLLHGCNTPCCMGATPLLHGCNTTCCTGAPPVQSY